MMFIMFTSLRIVRACLYLLLLILLLYFTLLLHASPLGVVLVGHGFALDGRRVLDHQVERHGVVSSVKVVERASVWQVEHELQARHALLGKLDAADQAAHDRGRRAHDDLGDHVAQKRRVGKVQVVRASVVQADKLDQ